MNDIANDTDMKLTKTASKAAETLAFLKSFTKRKHPSQADERDRL
jgi:hypothetical protein|tara:strand:- start:584 stop:718 length:135 start_codon:yes stop_codon:yes gene_type:complete